jgi:hypothetical protein
MDQLLSSSSHREDAALEINEVERIASQMSWDDLTNVRVQFGNNDADDNVQSGDNDAGDLENEGPGIGHGGWMDGQWHDPIDPHAITPRE